MMEKKLSKALADSIRDMETSGRTIQDCVDTFPDQADELRAHLEVWQRMNAWEKAQPAYAGEQRGEQRLLAAIRDGEREGGRAGMLRGRLATAPALVAAVAAAVVLLGGGAAGASSALGGPDVTGSVLSAMGIDDAPDAAENGKEHANPNAFEGSDNAGDGIENASETGKENANPNAFEGADNADDGRDNASETGQQNANPNAGGVTPPASPPDFPPAGPPEGVGPPSGTQGGPRH